MAGASRRHGNKTISTIFFDLDNTLIPTRKGDKIACFKVQNILVKNFGLTAEAAANASQNFLKSFRKCPENAQYSLHDWRHLLWKKALGDNHSEISGDVYIQWLNFRYKYIAPSQDVISLLESLGKVYYLAVITNGPSASQWEKIKRLKLSQYFHIILVSGDLQWEKPDKYIFLEACSRLGVLPEECIMVGDKPEVDILGGIEAGLGGTVWVPLVKNATKGAEIVADCVIDDVTRLKCLLSTKTTSKDLSSTINTYLGIDEPEMEDGNSNGSDGS